MSDEGPENLGFDAEGLEGTMDIMRGAFQVMTAAKLTGFTDNQAFQLSRDWFTTMMRISADSASEAPK